MKIECPACSSEATIESHEEVFWLSNLEKKVEHQYAQCSRCTHFFVCNAPSNEFLDIYYRNSPMLRRAHPTPQELDEAQRQLLFVASDCLEPLNQAERKKYRVLEIGAHTGAFLVALLKQFGIRGFFEELSLEAREVLLSQGFEEYEDRRVRGLVQNQFSGQKLGAEPVPSLDLIILRHVLEHVEDLPSFLLKCSMQLKSDGILFVECPDWSILDNNTDPLIFEHLHHFSLESIAFCLRRAGFQVVKAESSQDFSSCASPNRVLRILAKNSVRRQTSTLTSEFLSKYARNWQESLRKWVTTLHIPCEKPCVAIVPYSSLGFKVANFLDTLGIDYFFVDGDPKKQGKCFGSEKRLVRTFLSLAQTHVSGIVSCSMGYEFEIMAEIESVHQNSNLAVPTVWSFWKAIQNAN